MKEKRKAPDNHYFASTHSHTNHDECDADTDFTWGTSDEEDEDKSSSKAAPSIVDKHIAHLRLLSWLLIASSSTLIISTLTTAIMIAHTTGLVSFASVGSLLAQILNNPYVLIAVVILAVVALAVLIPAAIHCSRKVRVANKPDALKTLFGCQPHKRGKDSMVTDNPTLDEHLPAQKE